MYLMMYLFGALGGLQPDRLNSLPCSTGERPASGDHRSRFAENARRQASGQVLTQRLKRVFMIDSETCRRCGGTLRVIASIEEPAVINRIPITRMSVLDWARTESPAPM